MEYLPLVQLIMFVACGAFAWWLSYRFPMPNYKTKAADVFDRWYVVVAILLMVLHSAYLAPWVGGQLLHLYPTMEQGMIWFHEQVKQQPVALRWIEFIVLADFLGYFAHRFLHTWLGWRFHAIHHSPTSVNWLSGVRGTPIHYIVILSPTLLANYLFMDGLGFWPLLWFIVFDMLNQQFCHSNVALPFAKQLEYVLVTPRMHFIHHHPVMKYTNSNYGLYFSVWDRLFGTYVDADNVEPKGLLGLDYNESKWSGFWGLDRRVYPDDHFA